MACTIYHINKLKEKNHLIISRGAIDLVLMNLSTIMLKFVSEVKTIFFLKINIHEN